MTLPRFLISVLLEKRKLRTLTEKKIKKLSLLFKSEMTSASKFSPIIYYMSNGHLFSSYANISQKLTFLTCVCVLEGKKC